MIRKMMDNKKCALSLIIRISFYLLTGRASVFPNHKSSFVDGMGGKQVLDEMWPYVKHLVDDSIVVSLKVHMLLLCSHMYVHMS